jgi:hypothetical protein
MRSNVSSFASGAHLRGNDTRHEIAGHIQTVATFKKWAREFTFVRIEGLRAAAGDM